ncbi:MAG: RNA methyltransferase [Firmicutes bacterium]|nr:RNA methyltransferase [Bacillota bacterium]
MQNKKHRDICGVFVVEGKIAIVEALASGLILQSVLTNESFYKSNTGFLQKLIDIGIPCRVVVDSIFEQVSDVITTQGVLAVVQKPVWSTVDDVKNLSNTNTNCLYLDRIRDPGNMGTILRTAVATGFGLVFVDNCVDVFSQKVIRSAASALYFLDIIFCNNIDVLKPYYKTIATTPKGQDIYKMQLDKGHNKCLIIGNEANGIRQDILFKSDIVVCLPMHNIESLNASVAAGVLMYHLAFS